MRVSIVIPAYNEADYIGRCLQAALTEIERSKIEAEIIVVNNASTDRTHEVAASYPGVIVIDEGEKGISRARQRGFVSSRGEVVANIDADTRMPPGWLTQVVKAFDTDSKLVVLSGPLVYYDTSPFTRLLVALYYYFGFFVYFVNRFILHVGSLVQGGNFVIRRSALEQIGGFNPKFSFYGEDADIARRLHKVGRVRFTLGFRMPSSGRRLMTEGILQTALKYVVNYFSTIFFARAVTQEVSDIRFVHNKENKE